MNALMVNTPAVVVNVVSKTSGGGFDSSGHEDGLWHASSKSHGACAASDPGSEISTAKMLILYSQCSVYDY